TPDPNADPGPTGPNAKPVTITSPNPYQITSGTHVKTERGAVSITTNGLTSAGTIYDGTANDGSMSQFFYGTSSAFDLSSGFEQLSTDSSLPAAVFKFTNLEIQNAFTVDTTRGPQSLAFISEGTIASAAPGGTWDLSTLRGVTLATQNGSINLLSSLSFSGSTANLFMYARGAASDLTVASPITLTTGAVRLFGERNIALNGAYSTSGLVALNAGNAINLAALTFNSNSFTAKSATFGLAANGRINAQSVNIQTTGALTTSNSGTVIASPNVTLNVGGTFAMNTSLTSQLRFDITGLTQFNAQAGAFTFATDFIAPAGALVSFVTTAGGITGTQQTLRGITNVTVNGGTLKLKYLDAENVTVSGGDLSPGGGMRVRNAIVSGNLGISGAITPWSNGTGIVQNLIQTGGTYDLDTGFQFGGTAGTATTAPGHAGSLVFVAPNLKLQTTGSVNTIRGGMNFNGGDAELSSGFGGGSGGTFYAGSDTTPAPTTITVSMPLNATTGANATGVATGGNGGEIGLVANGTINVNDTVKVSDSAAGRASNSGGRINVKSNATTGTAISVSSSAQLLSLLSNAAPGPGGSIKITSAGGAINMSGTAQADKGTIEITNNGASGAVNLTGATLNASTVKAAAFGDNGQLNIGGGTISADTLISLYAGGSNGTVNFTDNVTLSGTSVKNIAGNTVTITGGKVVTINGNGAANVYTNNPNYTGSGGNGSTTGTFNGQGATTQPLSAAPGR
ncbi:MAG TPA: hypothetical protein VK993_14940, partial [Chthoniobacterales bacterium]|nr:hypothetical protein [Chthoniobacterales bacterium]